ncbi:MAG TPA: hypothetical protein VFV38_14740 [Ktedonobacteraceae bacterium]|nr:hypothetical protein [Ktedonobacteraceae bacterium]
MKRESQAARVSVTDTQGEQNAAPNMPARLRIAGQIREGQRLDASSARRDVRVTIIRGGASLNGYSYNEEALRTIAGLLENAQAYVDHADEQSGVRSVRDVVGFYRDAVYSAPDAETPGGRVEATLHILEAAGWLWNIIQEACELNNPGLIGLSIDIYGTWQPATSTREGQALKEVTGVLALNSCDVVTRPSAGGAFQHILHGLASSDPSSTRAFPQEGASPMSEQTTSPVPHEPEQGNIPADPERVQEQQRSEAETSEARKLLTELRLERGQLALERRLLECALPARVQARLRERYRGHIFEMSELERDLDEQRQLLADLAESGLIRGHGYEKPSLSTQVTEAEKIQAAFDRMFDLEIDSSKVGNVRAFTSIREAYARVTGDASVSGLSEQSQPGRIRIDEAAPIARISEADTTTATFAFLLGTSMNKRLLKDYQAWPAEWSKFCSITPTRTLFLNPRHDHRQARIPA